MKKVFFTLYLLAAYVMVFAQPGFLAPTNGGAGTLSSFQAATNTLSAAVTFPGTGVMPIGKLVKGSNGLFYGMTRNGGTFGKGSIFSFNSTTSALTTVKSFNTTDGENPSESLLLGVGGKLFGMTINGGANNLGVLFSFSPSTGVYEKLIEFSGFDGANPNGSLVTGPDRRLYGMTTFGGDSDNGVIFAIDTATVTPSLLKVFNGDDGSHPYGSLGFAGNKFYGATLQGGTAGNGVIFTYDPSIEIFSVIQQLDITAGGGSVYGDLTQAPNGKMYGLASVGGIFSVDISTDVFAWERPFGPGEGSNPNANLTLSTDGKLYGMTPNGGASSLGTIFSYNPANAAFAFISFNGTNGRTPSECSLLETQSCQSPVLTCPPAQTLCLNPSGNYTVPPLQLSPFCGTVFIGYEVIGAISRVGEGVNASGQFGPGISTIRWTVNDQQGGTSFCQTTVNVSGGFTATIPDGFVASPGVQPNTVYKGYLPASFILLHANPSGGTAPYSYTWSNGAHTPFIIVSPNVTTTYTVTITDSKGCVAVASKQVNVVDVRCGNWLDKVLVCKRINANTRTTVCVNSVQVLPLLLAGGTLGSCEPAGGGAKPTPGNNLQLKAHPNPTDGRFVLSVSGNYNTRATLTIRSVTGKVIEQLRIQGNQVVQVGASYSAGIYIAELVQGNERTTIKLVKLGN